jgi:molybdate-binding protein
LREAERRTAASVHRQPRALGLDFIPLTQKPYRLVIRRTQLELPPIQTLIETLGRGSFRREVEACIGYDMRTAGDRLI